MFDIYQYIYFFAAVIVTAYLVYKFFSKIPQGPVIYFNQSNGRSFAFPLLPTILFAIMIIGIVYFFLR